MERRDGHTQTRRAREDAEGVGGLGMSGEWIRNERRRPRVAPNAARRAPPERSDPGRWTGASPRLNDLADKSWPADEHEL